MRDRSNSLALLALIVVGGGLRLLCAFVVPNDYAGGTTFPDSHNYASIASNLATKFEFSNSYAPPDCYRCLGSIGPTSFREPLYPLLLAVQFTILGDSPRTTFVLQALLGTLTIPLCFAAASMVLSPRGALMAALLESVNPYHIRYVGIVAIETLSSVVLMSVVLVTLKVLRTTNENKEVSRWTVLTLGSLVALAVLVRSTLATTALVTLAFVAVEIFRQSTTPKTALRTVGLIVIVAAAGISPWLIRNYLLWERIVYHTASGETMLEGFNDGATGGFDGLTRAREIDRQIAPLGYDEVERDRILRHEAYEWIRDHPAKALRLIAVKQVLLWSPIPATVTGAERIAGGVWAATFLALAASGLIAWRHDLLAVKYITAVLITYSLFHSLAFAVTRFRVPLEALLAIPAGAGLDLIWRTLRAKRTPPSQN
jgi:hypothetical protein